MSIRLVRVLINSRIRNLRSMIKGDWAEPFRVKIRQQPLLGFYVT